MDHDQRFKILIQTFFQEFLRLFFAKWADRLDAAAVEWLDKEVFPDPPDGQRRVLDLVAKLPTRQAVTGQRAGEAEQWLALIHIEIESPDSVKTLRPRMCDAYFHLRRHYGLPVLPIGLYLRVGIKGIGIDVYEEHFWELQTVKFQYLYVGLSGLDAVEYVQGDNWLGVALAALMRIPPDRVAWLGAEALRRIQSAPLTDQQRFLLGECVQAYLPMDESQRQEFDRLVTTEPFRGVQAMNKTVYEQGIEKGIEKGLEMNKTVYEKGIEKGLEKGLEMNKTSFEKGIETEGRAALREVLERRFGALSPALLRALEALSAEQLRSLRRVAWDAQSLTELGLDT
jgi:hypothetical protein